jgi:WD40 repeat protein
VRLELLHTLRPEGGTIHAAAFSSDGRTLALGGELGEVRLLDVATMQVRWTAQPRDHWVGVLQFSPDGTRLACRSRHLTIHDAKTGNERLCIEHVGPEGFCWLEGGARFVYAAGGKLMVHDGNDASERARFDYPINAIAVGDGGASYFVGDNIGRTWRVAAAEGKPELLHDHRTNETSHTRSLALAVAGGLLFDLPSSGPLRRGSVAFEVPSPSFAFAVAADGRTFAVGGEAERVRWWFDSGERRDDLRVQGKVAALALHPDGKRLFVSTYSGQQAIHELGRAPVEVPGAVSRGSGAVMTPDGWAVAVKGNAWRLHFLDGRPSRALDALDVAPGRRGAELLLQQSDQVVVFDTRSGANGRVVPTPSRFSGSAVPGPGDLLFSGGALIDGRGERKLDLASSWILAGSPSIAFAPDGRWAVGAGWGIEGEFGALALVDAQATAVRLVEDGGPVYSVAFSPDGTKLFYSCGSGISMGMGPPNHHLRVRDAANLELLQDVRAKVHDWQFLDAKRALVGTWSELQVWDVDALEPRQTLLQGGNLFQLSEDRRTLLVRQSGKVQIYRVLCD